MSYAAARVTRADTRYQGGGGMGRRITSTDVAKGMVPMGAAKKAPTLARVNPMAASTPVRNSSLVAKLPRTTTMAKYYSEIRDETPDEARGRHRGLLMRVRGKQNVPGKMMATEDSPPFYFGGPKAVDYTARKVKRFSNNVQKADRRFDSEARRNQRLGGYAGAATAGGVTLGAFGIRSVHNDRKHILAGTPANRPKDYQRKEFKAPSTKTDWARYGYTEVPASGDEKARKIVQRLRDRHGALQDSSDKFVQSMQHVHAIQRSRPFVVSRRGALQLAGGAALLGSAEAAHHHARRQQERWR